MSESLAEQFELKIGAGIPGLVCQAYEHEDAIAEMHQVCIDPANQWEMATFDLDEGMMVFHEHAGKWLRVPRWYSRAVDENGTEVWTEKNEECKDAGMAIRSLPGLGHNKTIEVDGEEIQPSCILVMKNHHRWLTTPGLVQLVANKLWEYKQRGCHIVLLSPVTELPNELEKLFESGHMKHPLPNRIQIREIVESVAPEESEEMSEEQMEKVVDSLGGLTRLGTEDAVALSLREHDKVDIEVIFDLKAEAFEKSSASLQLYRGHLSFADYGGGDYLKEFCVDMCSVREPNPKFRSRGVFIVGPGGSGKTHFPKCLSYEVGRVMAKANLGRNKSKFQGEAQQNTARMFETMTALSPAIVVFDEVEGQVAGGKDTGAMDAGTKSEINSMLLEFLDNREDKDVFVVACCNDIRPILRDMPEFPRQGRFDEMFFMDYPGRASKDAIWQIHLAGFELMDPTDGGDIREAFAKFKKDVGLPDDTNWTGAEIEGCCAKARKRRHRGATVKTIGETMGTIAERDVGTIDAIREWAESAKCSATEYDGLYKRAEHEGILRELSQESDGRRRKVTRKKVKKRPPTELN